VSVLRWHCQRVLTVAPDLGIREFVNPRSRTHLENAYRSCIKECAVGGDWPDCREEPVDDEPQPAGSSAMLATPAKPSTNDNSLRHRFRGCRGRVVRNMWLSPGCRPERHAKRRDLVRTENMRRKLRSINRSDIHPTDESRPPLGG
jgi:hypothetical protein